jgi:hypothetical protein
MKSIQTLAVAVLVSAAPVSFAGTDDVGGFQSARDIAAQVVTGVNVRMVNVPAAGGTDVSGFQSARDVATHAGTMSAMAGTIRGTLYSGTDATGIQSVRDIM